MAATSLIPMEDLLKDSPTFFTPEPGTIVEGTVITVHKNRVLVDLNGVSTGVIAGREAVDSSDTVKDLEPGDEVAALVLEPENDEGLVVLSLRKASQQRTWKKFVEFYETKEPIKVKISEANKGGLLVDADGVKGFIPVSQLAPMHYPRVNGADSAKILARLQKLIGKELKVRIINVDHDNKKLILSEKEAQDEARQASLESVNVGDTVEGTISGVVNFGIFVTFNGLEGLVHISEIAWGHVSNPSQFGKLGDKIDVKVIGIDGEKISLSMKQLTANPWADIESKFKVGQIVEGDVNRITDYGAFVGLSDEINGLIHVSDVSDGEEQTEVRDEFKVGDHVKAKIVNIDVDNHRIGLSLDLEAKVEEVKAKSESKKEENDNSDDNDNSNEEAAEGGSDLESLGLSENIVSALVDAGFDTLEKAQAASDEDLAAVEGVGPATVKKIRG